MRTLRSGPATQHTSRRRTGRIASAGILGTLLAVTVGCSSSSPSSITDVPPTDTPESVISASESDGQPIADVVIDTGSPGQPIDPRIRGTNVPAWLGTDTLTSDWFLDAVREAGVTTLRLPGGSWSNSYDWAGCEVGDDNCYWTWAARPSDFVQLLEDTGLEGIWTVSINDTAESAAAAVAFFNGSPTDTHQIGVDREGTNWGTTGEWAALRVAGGHPEPAGITLWEVGNEVYGGKPDAGGDECAPFGWEDVWTCDGTDYVAGDAEHDGYLAFRTAMRSVDPTIEVGAVGVSDPSGWSNWGNEVVEGSGDALDFYVVHQYGFDQSPDPSEAFHAARSLWPGIISTVREAVPADTKLAVTEYNLVSFDAGDSEQSMTRAVNALFIAETIGQFAVGGVDIANQWNMANGTAANGTDYGLIDASTGERFPQFEALALWAQTGDELLSASSGLSDVRVYPTRRDDGSMAILLINFGDGLTNATITTTDGETGTPTDGASSNDGTVHTFSADDPSDTELIESGPMVISAVDGVWSVELPAWSMSLLEVASDG